MFLQLTCVLQMIKYQKNNIIFRIASADAISKFKNAQAASFLQLTRKELRFNDAAKEAVLLEFDRFSQWIFRIERICLAAGEGYLTGQLKNSILDSVYDELNIVENVMESHRAIFDVRCLDFAKTVHLYSRRIIDKALTEALSLKIDQAFVTLVGIISDYLQHLLLSFHEYNGNVVKREEDPFICASKFCAFAGIDNKFIPLITRAKFYVANGSNTTFVLKNYVEDNVFEDARLFFHENGIDVKEEVAD